MEENYKSLDSHSDLSRGDRDYLRRKGISDLQFDKFTPREQNEWKEECKNAYYERNDYELGTVHNQKTYF